MRSLATLDSPNPFPGHGAYLLCSFGKRFEICRFEKQNEKNATNTGFGSVSHILTLYMTLQVT